MNFEFESSVKHSFRSLKASKKPLLIDVFNDDGKRVAVLEFLTANRKTERDLIKLLAEWRREYAWYFPSQFKVTLRGTEKWFQKGLIEKEDRVLFMIKDLKGSYLGHMGLFTFDFKNKTCEIDNVVRGKNQIPGLMTFALRALIEWTYKELKIKKLFLRVFNDNEKAIALYERLNFRKRELIPLYRKIEKNATYWQEQDPGGQEPERYFLKMEWIKK